MIVWGDETGGREVSQEAVVAVLGRDGAGFH